MDEEIISFTDAPSADESQKLTLLGQELFSVDKEIKELEKKIEDRKARRQVLVMKELPDYLTDIGQDRVGLAEFNVDLVLTDYYHANIAADWDPVRREKAFNWLEDNGHGDLIKALVTIAFSRSQLGFAQLVVEELKSWADKDHGKVPEPDISMTVPWNTLTAFVREQTEKGVALPLDVLGATVGRIVKIKGRK